MILYTAWYGIVYSLVQYSMKNGIVYLSCIGKGNSTLRNDNWWPTMPLYSQSEPSSSCWHKHSHSDCSRLYVGWTKGQRTSKRCFTRVPTFGLSEPQSAQQCNVLSPPVSCLSKYCLIARNISTATSLIYATSRSQEELRREYPGGCFGIVLSRSSIEPQFK